MGSNIILARLWLWGISLFLPLEGNFIKIDFCHQSITMGDIFGITAPQACSKNILAAYLPDAIIVTTALILFYFFTLAAFFLATITTFMITHTQLNTQNKNTYQYQ